MTDLDLHNDLKQLSGYITNYGNFEDPVFRANFTNHVGNTYAIIHNNDKLNMDNLSIENHFIENMGDLSKGVLTPRDEVLNTGITKTVKSLLDNKLNFNDFNPNKVIFTEDIKTMPKEQLRDKIDYFMHQATKGLVMSKDEAKRRFENLNW